MEKDTTAGRAHLREVAGHTLEQVPEEEEKDEDDSAESTEMMAKIFLDSVKKSLKGRNLEMILLDEYMEL